MRPRSLLNCVIVLSPVILLGWVGVTGRVLNLRDVEAAGDPPGFSRRLEAYVPFIKRARALQGSETGDPLAPENLSLLRKALAELERPLPAVESTRLGVSARDDLRRPIFKAQSVVYERAWATYEALLRAKRYDEAAVAAVGLISCASVLRYSDTSSHGTSTRQLEAGFRCVRKLLGRLSAERLRWLCARLSAFEARGSLPDMMRTDFRLFTSGLLTEERSWDESGIAKLAAEALRAARNGQSLRPFTERVGSWGPGYQNSRLWTMLASWDIARKHEIAMQEMMRKLILEAARSPLRSAERAHDGLSARERRRPKAPTRGALLQGRDPRPGPR